LTTFLDQASLLPHPGGSEVLLKLAGHDATEQYEDIGHSTDARLMKDKYLVAEIVDEEKMTYSNDGEELFEKETIEAENKSDSTTMDPMVFVAILAVVFAIIYYFLLY
uniref:Cytochrome b5 n=1 Tax=Brugia timori TaxID=42155 RepID=A0A0R3QT01_9BILA